MTIQQLLSQNSVEDIVRTTMEVHDIDDALYQRAYANYARLIDTLLKLEAVPTDDILLGIAYEDDGELGMDTSVYKADQLANPIAYSAILEETVDPADLSEETLDTAIRAEGWPECYSYMFVPWAEVMGYQLNETNVEDVGAVPLLAEALYELIFFGFEEADMEVERQRLDDSVTELEAVRALPPEEQEQHPFGKTIDIDELWNELGLPPESPEEKTQRQLEMRHELFRNQQRTYHALRRYGGCAKEVAEDGSDVVEGKQLLDEADKEAEITHKTLVQRLADFDDTPLDERSRIQNEEISWGNAQGNEL